MIFDGLTQDVSEVVTRKHIYGVFFAVIIFMIGIFLAKKTRDAIERLTQLDMQQKILVSKFSYYGILLATVAATLSQLGVDVKLVVGAAGVLTVAVGFAAQTSTSNLISGLFLMIERPFGVGDVISVGSIGGDVRGEVMSIDLMSSRIRTFNNLMVRIPNETMVKSNLVNYSYFPIRRVDFNVGISYESDLRVVESTLRQVAAAHPLCLEDPQPIFIFQGFQDSSMGIQFQVWTLTENMTRLQNELYREIKLAFDASGIKFPFPTRTLITASTPSGSAPPTA